MLSQGSPGTHSWDWQSTTQQPLHLALNTAQQHSSSVNLDESLPQPAPVCPLPASWGAGEHLMTFNKPPFFLLPPQHAYKQIPNSHRSFLPPSPPPKIGQVPQLTSPPLAYSITKHRRSWVWKAYLRACEGNQNAGTE